MKTVTSFNFASNLLFSALDIDNNETVDRNEMMSVFLPLLLIEDEAGQESVNFIFDLCDVDGDGCLNKAEFNHFVYCYNICCQPNFIKIRADFMVVLFIEFFRAIDTNMGGTIDCTEASAALQKISKGQFSILSDYKEVFESLNTYCKTAGKNKEISQFEFLCISIRQDVLLIHLEAKYKDLFNHIDTARLGFLSEKSLRAFLTHKFTRGIEWKQTPKVLLDTVCQTFKTQTLKSVQFGYLWETILDVVAGSTSFTKEMCFRVVFKLVDTDCKGVLTKDQVVFMCSLLGINNKKSQITGFLATDSTFTIGCFVKEFC
ncbi:hypothetical protein EIN_381230 [Entamoeba invadens IP1]|uniref:EF-hand domain-containing protein n=1 Tax=Entamoeba invadens IP1 TaxID=370355 RepID=A0A0A1UEE0_ENTIV|nr:hypothetical protein EIN_381230 [Entamoeba invadens IP1]ELP92156.1 hypothetical protein EIN_381230 [Entamoeba invadens IP1]|eukprot:XP_004258927.1 hypothetical protein EIN_381230 [Entamoeba invadens IP1]